MLRAKVTRAYAQNNSHILLVEFIDQSTKAYDMTSIIHEYPVFEPLKQFSFFKNLYVDQTACAICWNDEIDIASSRIYLDGDDFCFWPNGT